MVGRAWLRAAGARVAVHGLEHIRADTTYVVVSNHQSNLDSMVDLRALPLPLRVLAMREQFQIWLLGRAMRTIGMIEVDRDSPDFGKIDQAAARALTAGHSLLVYPEGTTSRTARSASSKTAPSSSRSPARRRSCRSPSTAPAGSGRRAESRSTAARYAW